MHAMVYIGVNSSLFMNQNRPMTLHYVMRGNGTYFLTYVYVDSLTQDQIDLDNRISNS